MILVADSGSTKTDWKFMGEDNSFLFQTSGINPFYMSDEQIFTELKDEVLSKVNNSLAKIYFYGAGVVGEQKIRMEHILSNVFSGVQAFAESDLLGAARALCGDEAGIACIMGTGANSCLYDGIRIVDNIPPLGFIQGDEGSGAVLGKQLITMYLKRELSDALAEKFRERYNLDTANILRKVYQEAFPNRFLAGFSKFIYEHIEHEQMYQLVYNSFNEFLERNVYKYTNYQKMNIHFVGSVAFYFKSILQSIFNENNLKMGKIIKSPLNDLANYHLKHL
ncbi:MAG: ATPase [Bacteroidales bacterium]|nr:ATPase [Bacteroidales bacterium]